MPISGVVKGKRKHTISSMLIIIPKVYYGLNVYIPFPV